MKKVSIGIGDATTTCRGFVETWKRAERAERVETQHRINFESLETLLRTLTPARWVLLRTLRAAAAMSVRALANELARDYKNVHSDVARLEKIGLIDRDKDGKVTVPWDIVEARLRLKPRSDSSPPSSGCVLG